MYRLLFLLLCGAAAVPGAASAQDLTGPPTPVLAPFPAIAPTTEPPPVAQAAPAPEPTEARPTPVLATPTTAAPVLTEVPAGPGVAAAVGSVAGGMAGGVAGAAVAGPVGKFAGGFIGKRLARALFGSGKDRLPRVTAVQAAPSAESAAGPATAERATAPPLLEANAGREAETP